MVAWWESLSLFQQIMVCIAGPCSLIIVIKLILMLIGFGDGDTFDTAENVDFNATDMSSDMINHDGFLSLGEFKVFTLKGALIFLSIGGWLAMALAYTMTPWLASVIGVLGGSIVAFFIGLIFHYAMKLQSKENINYANAVNHTGTVYIPIPAQRKGKGKINMTIEEKFAEIDAVTDDNALIETGESVIVKGLEDNNTLIVERLLKNKDIK
jgi:hypothetical protein